MGPGARGPGPVTSSSMAQAILGITPTFPNWLPVRSACTHTCLECMDCITDVFQLLCDNWQGFALLDKRGAEQAKEPFKEPFKEPIGKYREDPESLKMDDIFE